jgi:hypothetical protein
MPKGAVSCLARDAGQDRKGRTTLKHFVVAA